MIKILLHKEYKHIFSLIIALLLPCCAIISQNLYKVEYNLSLTSPFSGTEFTYIDYYIRFTSSVGSGNYLYYNDGVETGASNTKTADYLINLPFNPDTVEFSAQTAVAGSAACDETYREEREYDSNSDKYIFPPTNNSCSRPSYNGIPVMLKIKDLDQLNISNTDNFLNSCESRTIRLNDSNTVMSYKVDYQLGSTDSPWTSFLPYARRSSDFDIQSNDFPGINSSTPLRLRVSYDQTNSAVSRKTLTLNYVLCSPKIIGAPIIEDTSCEYSQDGKFTVTFNRPLDDGEQLTNIGIYTAGPDDDITTTGDNEFTGAIPPTFSDPVDTYTYPNFLPAGDYILSYQANNTSTAELSDPFTIGAGPHLAYTITATDISCFEENDGTITISIDPDNNGSVGTPPYNYTINGGAPVNFTGTTTTIQNLGPNSYDIQVFDSKNCTERQ
ncbi:SprB repeat-containing protein [uncultured Dokdonia sp.]|uniref:SprB repeat-containing protein n=1 Tax=uncultured Dokdonia sp. TaxID=575653 RepID=UPI0030EF183F|tara:strand:- start:25983 stop:27308 length:1326 start_codon:yes stop_codon:yes gene_type:complete